MKKKNLSQLLNGYYEEYNNNNRLIINYLKTDILILYLSKCKLRSINPLKNEWKYICFVKITKN